MRSLSADPRPADPRSYAARPCRRRLPGVALALAACATTPARADAPGLFANPMPAIRADNWPAAEAAVQSYADPVARLLVTYYRLLAPNSGARADEIAAFAAAHPAWPHRDALERRREEALAAAPDGAELVAQCEAAPLRLAKTLLRCAQALDAAGRRDDAMADMRRAWTGTGLVDPVQEASLMRRWGSALTPGDQWTRFAALAWAGSPAAARQVARLDSADRRRAETWLALQHATPEAAALLAAVAPSPQEAGIFLDHARWLRRGGHPADALALWTADGAAALAAAPDHAGALWAERLLLARMLLGAGDARGAYALAAGEGLAPPGGEVGLDAAFLAGFIALRRLDDPAAAAAQFRRLAAMSEAAITQGRALYWLGRAEAALGRDAAPAWHDAAAWTCTYYGQLAALALGGGPQGLGARITALRDPGFTPAQAADLVSDELGRAAVLLVAWGETRRARAFLLRLDDEAGPAAAGRPARAALARLALGVDDPETAVVIARRMGRDGAMLPDDGWPVPYPPPPGPPDPAVTLGLIRQESSFDAAARSPVGARGLMQLMPATAEVEAKALGETVTAAALTAEPALNMRLGTAYLAGLLARYGGALPLAVAAYNAGPNRVDAWLAANGDPRGGPVEGWIDWIELIPFGETRNYVQRVLENMAIYAAKRGAPVAPLPITPPPAATSPVAPPVAAAPVAAARDGR